MRSISPYSIVVLGIITSLGVFTSVQAETYALGDPMIVACPTAYKGEMTVVETNLPAAPWQLLRWNCQGNQGLARKLDLLQYLQENPPEKKSAQRWEEKCPSGSIGNILFSSYDARRFVDSWTCSVDGSIKMSFEDLKRMLENKKSLEGISGVTQQRTCPLPYQGVYSVVYRNSKWDLQQWNCVAPGTKNRVTEPTMRMILPN